MRGKGWMVWIAACSSQSSGDDLDARVKDYCAGLPAAFEELAGVAAEGHWMNFSSAWRLRDGMNLHKTVKFCAFALRGDKALSFYQRYNQQVGNPVRRH